MGKSRTLIAAAAVILAAVSGIGVYFYVTSADSRAQRNASVVEAFVASQNIPKGTSADTALASGLITTAKVLQGSIPADAVTDTSALKGKVSVATISAKQFITSTSFAAPAEGGGGSLASAIDGQGLVAVTISVDTAHGVAGAIAPGDHVDIATVGDTGAQYLLQNVRVLAVGQATAASAPTGAASAATAQSSGLITFEVTSADALQVENAAHSGSLYLSLHSVSANGASATSG